MPTKNSILDEGTDAFTDKLREAQRQAREKLQRLVEERGIQPMSWEQLQALGDLWPEDESIDDFLEFLEEERSHSRQRSIDD
jgi:hypothetical protein